MADPETAYQKAVIRARFEFRGVPPEESWDDLTPVEQAVAASMVEELGEDAFIGTRANSLRTMDLAIVSLLGSLEESFPDRELTQDDVEEVVSASNRAFAQAARASENAVQGGINDAIVTIAEGHRTGLNEAASGVSAEISDDAIANMVERVKERSAGRRVASDQGQVVMRRVYIEAAGDTESFIRDNVGQPGREAARKLLGDLGDHDRILNALENEGPRGERVRRAIQRAGRAGDDIGASGRNLYANAKRAMAHELTQAQHEADVLTAQESPSVKALRWRVSARHPTLDSSPDVCDVLAEADAHGLGGGLYHPGSAPSLPHPYCECAVIPQTADRDEWGEISYNDDQAPNREPDPVDETEAGAIMRGNLTAESGPVTQASIERAVESINQRTAIAYDEFTDY